MPAGSTITLTYVMANWCGQRLFSTNSGDSIELMGGKGDGTLDLIQKSDPKLKLANFAVKPQENGKYLLELELQWRDMPASGQLEYTLYLDELASGLPLEAWQHIRRETWLWQAEMGLQGSTKLSYPWNPPSNTSRYRPPQHRTLLAHLSKGLEFLAIKKYCVGNYKICYNHLFWNPGRLNLSIGSRLQGRQETEHFVFFGGIHFVKGVFS